MSKSLNETQGANETRSKKKRQPKSYPLNMSEDRYAEIMIRGLRKNLAKKQAAGEKQPSVPMDETKKGE